MTTGKHPDDRHLRDTTEEPKRKLTMWLAGPTLVLVILLVVLFTWWSREGDETEDDDVTRIELVELARYSNQFLPAA